jgi:Fe-S-cluster containining protein
MSQPAQGKYESIQFRMRVAGAEFEAKATLPTDPVTAKDLLPLFRSMADGLVQIGVQGSERPVACGPGCGACCRQMVPISEAEAFALRETVEEMPEERQAVVRQRFADAVAALRAGGVDIDPDVMRLHTKEIRRQNGLRYFSQGIPCPFLEAESCSIHPVRPIACREYLVTNDPAHCSQPTAETIDMIDMPAKLSGPMYQQTEAGARVIPLVMALEWTEGRTYSGPSKSGREILQMVLQALSQ